MTAAIDQHSAASGWRNAVAHAPRIVGVDGSMSARSPSNEHAALRKLDVIASGVLSLAGERDAVAAHGAEQYFWQRTHTRNRSVDVRPALSLSRPEACDKYQTEA